MINVKLKHEKNKTKSVNNISHNFTVNFKRVLNAAQFFFVQGIFPLLMKS